MDQSHGRQFAQIISKSKELDAKLAEGIEIGKHPPLMSKLTEFVEEVEAGTKELEARVDELRPRFQEAMKKGRENMTQMQGHVERVTKSVETVEEFNRRMSNMWAENDRKDHTALNFA